MSYGDSTISSNGGGSGGSGSTGAGSDGGGGGGKQGESSIIQHSIIGDLFAATGAMLYGLFTTIVKIKVCYLYRTLYYTLYILHIRCNVYKFTLNEVIIMTNCMLDSL